MFLFFLGTTIQYDCESHDIRMMSYDMIRITLGFVPSFLLVKFSRDLALSRGQVAGNVSWYQSDAAQAG